MRKLTSVFVIAMFLVGAAFGQQTGKIKGRITSAEDGEGVAYAAIALYQNGNLKKGTQTDWEGNYSIGGLTPGKYDVKIQNIEFLDKLITGVSIIPGETRVLNATMKYSVIEGEVIDVVIFVKPLIERLGPAGGMDDEQISQMGTRNVSDVVNQVGGTVAKDDGETPSIKGARSSGTVVFVNGVKQIGSTKLPPSAMERVDVITGGVPAQYGDVVGGIVNITTKGASSEVYGGVEYETGRPFDQWNWDIGGLNISGPIISDTAKDEEGNVISDANGNPMKDTKLGYFFAAQYTGMKDPRPSAIGITKVKDSVLTDLLEYPLQRNANGYNFKAENLTADDFEKVKVRPNVQSRNVALNATLDFQPSASTTISFGGSYTYDQRRGYSGFGEGNYIYRYSLLNYNSNPLYRNNDYNVFARLRKSLDTEKEEGDTTASVISNAYYQVQIDYSKSKSSTMDPNHLEKVFNYGHLGMLDTDYESKKVLDDQFTNAGDYTKAEAMPTDGSGNIAPTDQGLYYLDLGNGNSQLYQVTDSDTLALHTVATTDALAGVYMQSAIGEYGVSYAPSPYNEYASNVLTHYFNLEDEIGYDVLNIDYLPARGLYYNGQRAPFIAGLWYGAGRAYGGYNINDNSQVRLSALASAEVNGKHQLTFGFEYEQRDWRSYGVNALGLWGLARSEVNSHFMNNDGQINYDYTSSTAEENINGKTYLDYDYIIDESRQSAFDKNLRSKMGYDDQEFIDLDAIDPENFSVDMFDANRLWDFNGGLIEYQGFDYTGKRLKNSSIAFEDFFTDSLTRPQASANPIYASFFLEDKFEIEDLIIRFGVRVDRYDANQRVLKDRYSTVDLSLVGETDMSLFKDQEGNDFVTPGVVEDDWAIYVDQSSEEFDNNQGDYAVIGFRDGETWYDASGNEVPNPTFFTGGSSILNPWFDFVGTQDEVTEKLFQDKKITLDAFEDYTPQINVMPRLAFSFPISGKAGFYAHYDVLTQRPTGGNITTPSDYFYLQQRGFLNNANLRPTKKINYQLGFQQKLSDYSALTLEAYYNEFRDLIAFTRVNYAYPASYTTFNNIDFGTSKGLTVGYDLRRKKNFRANISYTLQFAEGTGSSTGTAQALVSAGFDNLKVPFPLSFDQRHAIKTNMDYRFKEVKTKVKEMDPDAEASEDNAEVKKGGKLAWYSNMGLNLTLVAGSGTPYSKNASKQSEVLLGVASQSKLDGSPNGSRLPWNFRASLRVDKDIVIRKSVSEDKENNIQGKDAKYINVYLYVQNLFNNKNVLEVYRNTGQPDDDGYLVTVPDLTQSEIDMYQAALLNPSNISIPRRARVGVTYAF